MKGKIIYLNQKPQISLFGSNFALRYKNLTYAFEGKKYSILPYFISTIGLEEKKIEIEIDWKWKELLTPEFSLTVDLSSIFENCNSLECMSIDFELLNIINMSKMFSGCTSLKVLPDLSTLDVGRVSTMEEMFYDCQLLISLPNISKWKTDKLNIIYIKNFFFKFIINKKFIVIIIILFLKFIYYIYDNKIY